MNICHYVSMQNNAFNFDYLRPTGPLGVIIIVVGIFFTTLMAFVFYQVTNDLDSLSDKQRKQMAQREQDKKIARLYPSKKS